MTGSASVTNTIPMKKDRTENIQKTYKKCAPYGNCTEIVQKIYRKCAKICNNSNNEPVSTNELLHNLAHFLYIFCTISVQFPYGAHFLYVFCMFSVRSFFIGMVFVTDADPVMDAAVVQIYETAYPIHYIFHISKNLPKILKPNLTMNMIVLFRIFF